MLSRTVRSWGSIPTSSSFLVPMLNRQEWMCNEHCYGLFWGRIMSDKSASTRWCRFPVFGLVRYAWRLRLGLSKPAGLAVHGPMSTRFRWLTVGPSPVALKMERSQEMTKYLDWPNKTYKSWTDSANLGVNTPWPICTDLAKGCLISDGISSNEVKRVNTWASWAWSGMAWEWNCMRNQQTWNITTFKAFWFHSLHPSTSMVSCRITGKKPPRLRFFVCSRRNQALKLAKKACLIVFLFVESKKQKLYPRCWKFWANSCHRSELKSRGAMKMVKKNAASSTLEMHKW